MKNISLALSGGGLRAIAFHMGVLKYLSEKNLFENIARISSVSGGSLLIGLILRETSMKWPDSSNFLSHIYPVLRNKLCTISLFGNMLRTLINPLNFHFFIYRANLLSKVLKSDWGIRYHLSDLPKFPEISINATTAETGKRFRFKRDTFGDYELGYALSNDFPLSDALAVSAAFPGCLGPLIIKSHNFIWKKRKSWDDPEECKTEVILPYSKLHLYDGGVYDNLGLESFFDVCKGISKVKDSIIIISDASAPYTKGFSYFTFNPWRLKRVIDIIHEQTRYLRVRSFFGYIQRNSTNDKYICIKDELYGELKYTNKHHVANFPTSLTRLSLDDFDRISQHGYAVTQKYFSDPYGKEIIC